MPRLIVPFLDRRPPIPKPLRLSVTPASFGYPHTKGRMVHERQSLPIEQLEVRVRLPVNCLNFDAFTSDFRIPPHVSDHAIAIRRDEVAVSHSARVLIIRGRESRAFRYVVRPIRCCDFLPRF